MRNNSVKVWYKHTDGHKKQMYLHLLDVAIKSGYKIEDPAYDAAGNLKGLTDEKVIPESKAEVVGEPAKEIKEEVKEEDTVTILEEDPPDLTTVKIDYSTKKMTDLREMAKIKGIAVPFGSKKIDLIELLENNGQG